MTRTLALAFALVCSGTALAQKLPAPRKTEYAPRKQVIQIEEDERVDGSAPSPGGETVGSLRHSRSASWIHARESFLPEMIRSAERW